MVVVVHKPWKAGRLERHISATFQTETLERSGGKNVANFALQKMFLDVFWWPCILVPDSCRYNLKPDYNVLFGIACVSIL